MLYLAQCYGCVHILVRKLPYSALHALGLVVWQPRRIQQVITPQHIRINARCLVLSFYVNEVSIARDLETQKILLGMLSVLQLEPYQIMQASIYGSEPDLALINSYILDWQPEYILQLSMEFPEVMPQRCVRTFSPQYLHENKQYKAQAYKTLLGLREMLHGPEYSSS